MTIQPSLFTHICICGKLYGETCNNKPSSCPEFLKHKQEVIDRSKQLGIIKR